MQFLLIFIIFFRKKKVDFPDYQSFVCPCAVHCDSEHKQINLYLDKKFYCKLLYTTLDQKELGELLHCFINENKKKCGFCDDYDNCIYCKKLKYIRQCLDNAYIFLVDKTLLGNQPTGRFFYIFKSMRNSKKSKNLFQMILIFV